MTVSELITELQKYSPNINVYSERNDGPPVIRELKEYDSDEICLEIE